MQQMSIGKRARKMKSSELKNYYEQNDVVEKNKNMRCLKR